VCRFGDGQSAAMLSVEPFLAVQLVFPVAHKSNPALCPI
jgi:hypothetical protein